MSTRTEIRLICDLTLLRDREEVPAAETLRYYDPETGELRETDLTADYFSEFSTEIAALFSGLRKISRPVENKPKGRRPNAAPASTESAKENPQEMRTWLRANGWTVNDRGAVPKHLKQAFKDKRPAPVQEEVEVPPQPEETWVPTPRGLEVTESEAVTETVEEQLVLPAFEPTEWELAHPRATTGGAGRLVAGMTDEERFAELKDSQLNILQALHEGVPEKDIPYLSAEPTQRKVLNLGMMDGAAGKFTVTGRGVDALKRARRL